MSELKRGRVIEFTRLKRHGVCYFGAVVPQPATPQSGQAVEHATPLIGDVVTAFRAHDHARIAFELAVRGKRHPVCFEFGSVVHACCLIVEMETVALYRSSLAEVPGIRVPSDASNIVKGGRHHAVRISSVHGEPGGKCRHRARL